MIYADLKDLSNYLGISENLNTAIAYLQKQEYLSCKKGRNEVSGEDIYVNCMEYTTMEESDAFFEAHEEYLDIHVIVGGKERIGVSDIGRLVETERDQASDYVGYAGKAEIYCPMNTDKFLVVFPRDAHMVKLKDDMAEKVKKIVVKVKIQKG